MAIPIENSRRGHDSGPEMLARPDCRFRNWLCLASISSVPFVCLQVKSFISSMNCISVKRIDRVDN